MRWFLIVVAALVALVLVVVVIGALRPADHVASVTARLAKNDSLVWDVVSDFAKVPSWFSEVRKVERIADVDGRPAFRENYGGFEVTVVTRELAPRRRIVREILPSGSFSGTWTMELTPGGDTTSLTITERGHVGNPLFRGMMALTDPKGTKTMRAYLAALAAKLGTAAEFTAG